MITRVRSHQPPRPTRGGFTLIELLVVVLIIGIVIAFILVAAGEGVQRAYEKGTLTLITKLETGLNDRLEALTSQQPEINGAHQFMATITVNSTGVTIADSWTRRAQVIAMYDLIRAEIPDVFFLNYNARAGTGSASAIAKSYPLNFGGGAYPGTPIGNANSGAAPYILPLGNSIIGLTNPSLGLAPGPGAGNISNPVGTGIFGASYNAAAGIYKQLYQALNIVSKNGYDGVDNNGDKIVDDLAEGGVTLDQMHSLLVNHTHKTARAEMLYAVLVEGVGPLGSVFKRDDFTNREVGDTDGDGLMEFIDGWGEPIQFFRWPIYYSYVGSDSQKGFQLYGQQEQRQQDPLDPNGLLMSPAWFSGNFNVPSPTLGSISLGAELFIRNFHTLLEPNLGANPAANFRWDRTGSLPRRAFYSKFLILSGGRDKEPGVGMLDKDYTEYGGTTFTFPTGNLANDVAAVTLIENNAAQVPPTARSGIFLQDAINSTVLQDLGVDDITNQGLQSPGTGVR